MFGKEYVGHLNILTQSFGQMNNLYQKKIKKRDNYWFFIEKLKNLYIRVFGIPEIGFQIRSLYLEKICRIYLLNKHFEKILDAGSGIGMQAFFLGETFPDAKITGGDIDTYKLQSCKDLTLELKIKNVTFVYFDATKTQKTAEYDLIVCIDVLEHIDKYKKVLNNFYHLLNRNGYLFIHVPQPNQKRILNSLKKWHHEDHVREGIAKIELEIALKKLGFKIIKSKETFGFFGKLAWEINHLMLSRSFILTGITFSFLFFLAKLDPLFKNNDGLGIAILAKKPANKKS